MRDAEPPPADGDMTRHYILVFLCEAIVILTLWAVGRLFS